MGDWSLGQLCFSFFFFFLASCYDRSPLHEFLFFFFFGRTNSYTAQTRCVGGFWSNFEFIIFLANCFHGDSLHEILSFFFFF